MTEDETHLFKLLDGYSRSQYHCFVSELFIAPKDTDYTICFRPVNVKKGSANQAACVYVTIEVGQARIALLKMALTGTLIEELDRKLRPLQQLV